MKIKRRDFIKSSAFVAASSYLGAEYSNGSAMPFRVVVIGHTGRGNYGHGLDTLWLDVPECKVVAVADPIEDGLEKARVRLGGVPGYADYREMLRVVRPDIVSVAPRHIDQHCEMVLAAAEAGVKGIYLEKPFCRDLKEADQIVDACTSKGLKLVLAHRNRYHPALVQAQKLVTEGQLGRVLEVRGRGKEDRRGGPLDLWVLGSHVLNLVPLFTGAFTSCSASLLKDNRPVVKADLYEGDEGVGLVGGDQLHVRFDTQKGIPFYFDSVREGGVAEGNFGFQILGNKGVLDVRIDTEPLVHYLPANSFYPQKDRPEWVPVTSGGVGVKEPVKSIDADIAGHQAAIRDLMTAVRNSTPTLCNEQEGRATVEAIMAVFESHRRGGVAVDFPLKIFDNPLNRLTPGQR